MSDPINRGPLRGGYEMVANEGYEMVGVVEGVRGTLSATGDDPDDVRVRVRPVEQDDALLADAMRSGTGGTPGEPSEPCRFRTVGITGDRWCDAHRSYLWNESECYSAHIERRSGSRPGPDAPEEPPLTHDLYSEAAAVERVRQAMEFTLRRAVSSDEAQVGLQAATTAITLAPASAPDA